MEGYQEDKLYLIQNLFFNSLWCCLSSQYNQHLKYYLQNILIHTLSLSLYDVCSNHHLEDNGDQQQFIAIHQSYLEQIVSPIG